MKQIIIIIIFLVYTVSSFGQTSSIQEGNKCFDKGEYDCAIAKYNEVLKLVSGKVKQIAEIHLGRARSCSEWLKTADQTFSQGNFNAAKINYQNVLNENPNDPYAKTQLEKCTKALITLKVSKNSLSFSASGGNETISVNTDAESYSISTLPPWFTVRKDEGSFVVTCSANTGNTTRSGYISVSAGDKTERINISQHRKGAEISLTTSRQNVVFKADLNTRTIIDVNTNATEYNVTNLPDWCSVGKKNPTWFSLVCEDNNSGLSRKGSFRVTAGGKEVRINISQVEKVNTITNTSTGTQHSNSITSYPDPIPDRKKKCFNCPKTKDTWGFTLGYTQIAYNPFERMALSPVAYWNGIQFGLRIEPLFKYGFGLTTGILMEAYSNDLASTWRGESKFGHYSLNIPLHLEYRLNFSKWFNVFAYGGAGFNLVANSSFDEFSLPATFEYGAGVRFNRIQFNMGKSLYMGTLRDIPNIQANVRNIGKDPKGYQNLAVSMSYMF